MKTALFRSGTRKNPLKTRGLLPRSATLELLNAAGFGQATTYSIWSRELGYLAGEGDIVQFIAVKERRTDADKAVISGVAHPSDLDGSIARG